MMRQLQPRNIAVLTNQQTFCPFQAKAITLGDILISSETAYNQARKFKNTRFETNIRRLLLHGLLHLMGYDHETDNGEMRAIERRLRRRFQC